jgi:hypothetical protein
MEEVSPNTGQYVESAKLNLEGRIWWLGARPINFRRRQVTIQFNEEPG